MWSWQMKFLDNPNQRVCHLLSPESILWRERLVPRDCHLEIAHRQAGIDLKFGILSSVAVEVFCNETFVIVLPITAYRMSKTNHPSGRFLNMLKMINMYFSHTHTHLCKWIFFCRTICHNMMPNYLLRHGLSCQHIPSAQHSFSQRYLED